jgi:hypothetical protein
MKNANLFLVVLLPLSAGIRIPMRNLEINITVSNSSSPDSGGIVTSFQLSPSGHSMVVGGHSWIPRRNHFFLTNELVLQIFPEVAIPGTSLRVANVFAIGPRSTLVNRFNSVAVIKNVSNNGFLSLGISMDEFLDYCVPGTFMSAATPALITPTARLEPFVNWMPFEWIARLPEHAFSQYTEPLVRGGAVRVPGVPHRHIYSNCTAELIHSLPNLNLDFAGGTVVLTSADYTRIIPETNSCELRITEFPMTFNIMNPIQIPGVNLMFTRNETFICDSIYS